MARKIFGSCTVYNEYGACMNCPDCFDCLRKDRELLKQFTHAEIAAMPGEYDHQGDYCPPRCNKAKSSKPVPARGVEPAVPAPVIMNDFF